MKEENKKKQLDGILQVDQYEYKKIFTKVDKKGSTETNLLTEFPYGQDFVVEEGIKGKIIFTYINK